MANRATCFRLIVVDFVDRTSSEVLWVALSLWTSLQREWQTCDMIRRWRIAEDFQELGSCSDGPGDSANVAAAASAAYTG